jgi:hypothetical protein
LKQFYRQLNLGYQFVTGIQSVPTRTWYAGSSVTNFEWIITGFVWKSSQDYSKPRFTLKLLGYIFLHRAHSPW